jgi:nitrilase
MKVAAIQMVSGPHVADNLRDARALLAEAARAGAELAVLPEYFCVMGHRDTDKLALQEPLGSGPIQDWLAATARELGLWIVGGTLPLSCEPRDEQRVRNASLGFSPQGERVACYDKIHLFKFDDGTRTYDEAAVLARGSQPTLFDLPSRDGHRWRIGMSVCYDLRFAELYRAYAAQGADLLLVPSAFTYVTGQAHWEVLLRARAIENLSGVIAAAQGGVHDNGRRTWGHSMVVDAWGQVLAQRAEGPGVVLADLDAAALAARRAQLPALGHRVLG